VVCERVEHVADQRRGGVERGGPDRAETQYAVGGGDEHTSGIDGAARLDFVYGLMPEVAAMRDRKALVLSGGQQKLVALARALIVGTRLLLLDEPFEGVAPALSRRLADVIGMLRGKELAVLIAQSDLNHSVKLLDREYVIERGANRGSPAR